MSRDYMPHDETQFAGWTDSFVAFAESKAGDIGLTEEELLALRSDHEEFDSVRKEQEVIADMARGMCKTKNAARRRLSERMRRIAMRIQTSPAINDSDRRALGLSLGEPREYVSLDRSVEIPHAVIDARSRLRHVLRITNKTELGTTKARPGNATGCEIWMVVGDPHSQPDLEDMRYVGTVTNGRRLIEFPYADGGKTAYYRLRWVGRRSTVGTWSQTHYATIAA